MFDQKNYEEFYYVNATGLHFFIGRGKGKSKSGDITFACENMVLL